MIVEVHISVIVVFATFTYLMYFIKLDDAFIFTFYLLHMDDCRDAGMLGL